MSYTSPHIERFNKISEKLANIQQSGMEIKSSRIDLLDHKIQNAEDKLNEMLMTQNKKLNALKDESVKLQKIIEEDNRAFDINLENRLKEILSLEQKFTVRIEQETANRKDSENKIARIIDERFSALKQEVGKETKIRVEIMESLNQTLASDLPKLSENVQQEATERESIDGKIVKKVTEEINKINDNLQGEKKAREESEASIFEMLRDLVNRAKLEIDAERKERELSEEQQLALIDEACSKLSALHHS